MSQPICDPAAWRDAPYVLGIEDVQARIPQRHEFGVLHGIVHHVQDEFTAIGIHQSREDDFWVRGHLPGRPIFPGVLMVEAAAQLSAFCSSYDPQQPENTFFGFGGLENVRFRGQVPPGARLVLAAKALRLRRGFARYLTQVFHEDTMVYEGEILGVSI